jgi:hypothetical protein
MLGVKSAARDAFLILAATAREQYQRWVATINLMELAAEERVSIQFERYRQQLASAKLPPLLQTQFELHVGRGYQTFGDLAAARTWLQRAVHTALGAFAQSTAVRGRVCAREEGTEQRTEVEHVVFELPETWADRERNSRASRARRREVECCGRRSAEHAHHRRRSGCIASGCGG